MKKILLLILALFIALFFYEGNIVSNSVFPNLFSRSSSSDVVNLSISGPNNYKTDWVVPKKYLALSKNRRGGVQSSIVLHLSLNKLVKSQKENSSNTVDLSKLEGREDLIEITLSFGGREGAVDSVFEGLEKTGNFIIVDENFSNLKLYKSQEDYSRGSPNMWAKPVDEARGKDIYMWMLSTLNSKNHFQIYSQINGVASMNVSYSLSNIKDWEEIDWSVRKFVMALSSN